MNGNEITVTSESTAIDDTTDDNNNDEKITQDGNGYGDDGEKNAIIGGIHAERVAAVNLDRVEIGNGAAVD